MTFSRVPTAEFHKLTLKPAMVALSLKSKKKKLHVPSRARPLSLLITKLTKHMDLKLSNITP